MASGRAEYRGRQPPRAVRRGLGSQTNWRSHCWRLDHARCASSNALSRQRRKGGIFISPFADLPVPVPVGMPRRRSRMARSRPKADPLAVEATARPVNGGGRIEDQRGIAAVAIGQIQVAIADKRDGLHRPARWPGLRGTTVARSTAPVEPLYRKPWPCRTLQSCSEGKF